jgi:hypothetical protein
VAPLTGVPIRSARRAGLAAQRQADVVLQAAQARRPLGMRPGNGGQAFGEDAVLAAGSPAAKPPHLHLDLHAAALPGQIGQAPWIAAVPPRRRLAATGAERGRDAGPA